MLSATDPVLQDPTPDPDPPGAGVLPLPTRTHSVYAVRIADEADPEAIDLMEPVAVSVADPRAAWTLAERSVEALQALRRAAAADPGRVGPHFRPRLALTHLVIVDDSVPVAELAAGRSNVAARLRVAA